MKDIPHVLNFLKERPAQGILVVPLWPGSIFWPRLTTDGTHLLPMFYKKHIFRTTFRTGVLCDRNVFNPDANHIQMLGLVFNSTRDPKTKPSIISCLKDGCDICS